MEVLQSVSDSALKKCPVCDQPKMEKLISAAGFRLSGSGWYETDFKSSNKRNLSGEAAPPADAKKSDEKKTPAKSDNDTAKTKSASE